MSISPAIVLPGEPLRRRPSPFALGLQETLSVSTPPQARVEASTAVAPKAVAQSVGRAKLSTQEMEARALQRAEDDELIRAAQRGDRSAFDSLVRRYDRSVLRLALHMLGNEQDAQDVHQDAFIKAYRFFFNFRF